MVDPVKDVSDPSWMSVDDVKAGDFAVQSNLAIALEENQRLRTAVDEYKNKIEALLKGPPPELDCPSNLYQQLEDKVGSPDFVSKLEQLTHKSGSSNEEEKDVNMGIEDPSWWVWIAKDLFDNNPSKSEDIMVDGEYVLVTEDDIIEGIAMFMASYIMSIPQAKNMSPSELQAAMTKAFKNIEKKGYMWRLWQMGKFLYSIATWASWGTSAAIGFYKHPIVLRALLMAASTSLRLFFKLII